ncbi:Ig domain-containing protein [Agromyces soli]
MNETSDLFRRREPRGRRRATRAPRRIATRRTATRRTALLGGAIAVGATLPFVGLAATAQAADPDTQAPASTAHLITEPPSGWFQSATQVAFTADDFGGTGIATIAVVVDGVGRAYPGAATGWFPIAGDGVHTIDYRAIDNSGNLEAWRTLERRIDGGAPTASVPADGVFELGAEATLSYACEDAVSGIASCSADASGVALPSGGALDTSAVGTFTVPVTAVDVAGNSATAVYTYTVVGDAVAPAVTIHVAPEPASGWYRSYLGIEFTAEDPSGIASLHWNSEGAVSANGDAEGEAWAGFDLTVDGVTEFDAWAYDGAGNRGEAVHRTVRVDTIAPRIDLASPELAPDLEFEQGERVPLEFDCADEHSGIVSCVAQDELPLFDAADASDSASGELLPTDELGEHVVTLRALDLAGNQSELEVRYLVVEPAEEPGGGGGSGGEGSGGGSGQPGQGDGDQHGQTGTPGRGDGRSELADTGFPVVPGLLLVGGLLAAGALLMVRYSGRRDQR